MIVSLLQLGLASQPDTIGLPTGRGAGLCILDRVWNIGIMGQLWCLTKPCFGHFIYKVSKVEFANKLLNSSVRFFYHRIHKRSCSVPCHLAGFDLL